MQVFLQLLFVQHLCPEHALVLQRGNVFTHAIIKNRIIALSDQLLNFGSILIYLLQLKTYPLFL